MGDLESASIRSIISLEAPYGLTGAWGQSSAIGTRAGTP